MPFRIAPSVVLVATLSAGVASAQPSASLQQAKDLYAEAAYEDALRMLTALPVSASSAEVARYRAACLVALNRADEARTTVAAIVEAQPEYQPDPNDTSPRVLALFADARRDLLPAITRRLYAEARAAMEQKDPAAATGKLEHLVKLLDSPELASDPGSSDLRLLASGFLDLARAQESPKETAPADVAENPPPAPPAAKPVVTQAEPLRQVLPPWTPPAGASQYSDFVGAVRVQIGTDGKVQKATMAEGVHPAYDGALLLAARNWLYQPATRDGVPVTSERLVRVVLKGR